VVKSNEVVDSLIHEGVVRRGKDEVIRNTDGDGLWEYNGVCEEGIEWLCAANVEIEVDTAIVVEDEVSDGIGTLDGVGVAVKGREEPWVVFFNELA
jgi:hypothetical protein